MKPTAVILALALLATGAVLATPGAAAFQCDGFPPNPERVPECVEYMRAWAERELDELPDPQQVLDELDG